MQQDHNIGVWRRRSQEPRLQGCAVCGCERNAVESVSGGSGGGLRIVLLAIGYWKARRVQRNPAKANAAENGSRQVENYRDEKKATQDRLAPKPAIGA
jgi:hypothetical protein